MDRKRLLKRLVALIVFIFIINFIAGALYWYYSIWWFDMPMHFLGGFWLGLGYIWLFWPEDIASFAVIWKLIAAVLTIGILWEIYEIGVNNLIARNPFNALDTISDLFFDLAGGTVALLYAFKGIMSIMPKKTNKVQ